MKITITCLFILFLAGSVFPSHPEIKIGFGYTTTIDVTDTTVDSPLLIEEGIFYDEISPEFSVLWNFGTISAGPRFGYYWSRDIFGTAQETTISSFLYGGEIIYNFVMTETGEWLFPIILNGGYQDINLCYRPSTGTYNIDGNGLNVELLFGVERLWDNGLSFGFVLGRRLSGASFEDSSLEIAPRVQPDGWRFEFLLRFRPVTPRA